MKHYIIGVDGGGTKTLGVLFDLDGNEISRVTSGFANFSVDETKTINHIKEVLSTLAKQADGVIDQILIGVAGYTNYLNKEVLLVDLQTTYKTNVNMVTDAEIALYSVKQDKDQDVILILGGTGSVIIIGKDETIEFIGGYGHLLGDEGSAYHLAITLLKDIIKCREEQKELSLMQFQILASIKTKGYEGIKEFVYNSTKSEIAELSMNAAFFAEKGDVEAIKLFKNEATYLALQAENAYQLMNTDQEIIIGFKGGFLLNAPYVRETLIEELQKRNITFRLNKEYHEPVKGAYYVARRIIKRGENNGRH